jgi:YVTN family beta-propeller protein
VAVRDRVVFVPEFNGQVTLLHAANGVQFAAIPTGPGDYFGGPITNSGPVWFVEELQEYGMALRIEAIPGFKGVPAAQGRIPDPRAPSVNETRVRFGFAGIAAGAHGVWAAGDALDRRVLRIDPQTARFVKGIHLGFPPGGIAAGQGSVWVTDQLDDAVARINPATNRVVQTIPVGREPTGIAVGHGSVWVANTLDRSISRIDLNPFHVTTIPLKVSPKSVTVGDGAVWVAASAD